MVYISIYGWPSTSTDSQLWIKNTVIDLWLNESTEAKTGHMEGQLYIY